MRNTNESHYSDSAIIRFGKSRAFLCRSGLLWSSYPSEAILHYPQQIVRNSLQTNSSVQVSRYACSRTCRSMCRPDFSCTALSALFQDTAIHPRNNTTTRSGTMRRLPSRHHHQDPPGRDISTNLITKKITPITASTSLTTTTQYVDYYNHPCHHN